MPPLNSEDDSQLSKGPGQGAGADPAFGITDRRRPAVARLRFEPDPRRLRTLLAEVEVGLEPSDPLVRRRVRLLVGEIVSRLLIACPRSAIELDLEVMADSVRVDIRERGDERCHFWEVLDDALFSDLTSAWGRDRRGRGGAWFEIAQPTRRPVPPAQGFHEREAGEAGRAR
jgi:hypothetical protein